MLKDSSTSPRSLRGSLAVANSSEHESDSELSEIVVDNFYRGKAKRRRLFKEVAVPSTHKSDGGNRRKSILSTTPHSSNASEISTNEWSNEYATPETSVIATPADTSFNKEKKLGFKGKVKAALDISPMETSDNSKSNANNKRKRGITESDHQLMTDELLAKKLQEQEYARESFEPLGKAQQIADSEELDLTTSESDSDFEISGLDVVTRSKARGPRALNRTVMQRTGPKRPSIRDESGSLEDVGGQDNAMVSHDGSEMSSDFSLLSDDSSDEVEDGPRLPNSSNNLSTRGSSVATRHARGTRRGRFNTRAEYERDRLEVAHPEIKTLWQDLEKIPTIKPERRTQPKGISRQLKPFQLEGLDWMIKQEQTQYRGGLLGDEMGMGNLMKS